MLGRCFIWNGWLVVAHVKLVEGATRDNCITTMDSYSYTMEHEMQSLLSFMQEHVRDQ